MTDGHGRDLQKLCKGNALGWSLGGWEGKLGNELAHFRCVELCHIYELGLRIWVYAESSIMTTVLANLHRSTIQAYRHSMSPSEADVE